MNNSIGKLAASCVLFGAFVMAHAQNQYDYKPMPTAPASQAYQQQQQSRPLPQFNDKQDTPAPDASHYDPLAGNHKFQHRQGGFWEGVRKDVNPCSMNYGEWWDGWQDMGLLMTVKSWQCWVMFISAVAAIVFGLYCLYYKQRITNIREATAAALLLAMNDRAHAVRGNNEAVERHNKLVAQLDEQGLETSAQARIEIHTAARAAAIQAAEQEEESGNSAAVRDASTHGLVVIPAIAAAQNTEPVVAQTSYEEVPSGGSPVGDSGSKKEQESGDGQVVTVTLDSGIKYKVPRQVQLYINALKKKNDNMRNQVRKLEESLKVYENA
jgi:hypothetical protein